MGVTRAKKFGNVSHKVNVILSVFEEGEKLNGKQIVERVRQRGYEITDSHLKMFIYYNMLHKHLKKEEINGVNYYYRINR